MKRINVQEDIQPLSEFRANAAAMLRQVGESQRPLVLTQRGHSTAVVLDVAQYERLLQELELLRDIHAAERQIARGEGLDHDDARAEVLEQLDR